MRESYISLVIFQPEDFVREEHSAESATLDVCLGMQSTQGNQLLRKFCNKTALRQLLPLIAAVAGYKPI